MRAFFGIFLEKEVMSIHGVTVIVMDGCLLRMFLKLFTLRLLVFEFHNEEDSV